MGGARSIYIQQQNIDNVNNIHKANNIHKLCTLLARGAPQCAARAGGSADRDQRHEQRAAQAQACSSGERTLLCEARS